MNGSSASFECGVGAEVKGPASTHKVEIEDVVVEFPFQPYPVQTAYMESVIKCLNYAKFGLLESPTGTGKTLSLLCSSLAWLQTHKVARAKLKLESGGLESTAPATRIIYASRTHSQLTQVISEFSSTAYKHFPSAVLGSRDQLCINPAVLNMKNIDKNILCRSKLKAKSCEYYNKYEKDIDRILSNVDPCQNDDIENLKKMGHKQKICPYYYSRNSSSRADIVFLPYNYLFDAKIRKTLNIELDSAVIILDEAHNVLRNCEDANSFTFDAKDIAVAITELDYVIKIFDNESLLENLESAEFTVPEICSLKEIIIKFENELISLRENSIQDYNGDKIHEILESSGINNENASEVKDILGKVFNFLTSASLVGGQAKGRGTGAISSVLNLVFQDNSNTKELLKSYFKLHIDKNVQKNSFQSSNNKNTIFNLWCFSPGFCMKSLIETGIRSIILTSGTLKPMDSFCSELLTDFQVKLQNNHIITNQQILVRVAPNGVDNSPLSSAYLTRSDPKYLNSLGFSILKIFRSVPDGVLIFFPSYTVMNSCIEYWQNTSSLWTAMQANKPIFIEPKEKGILPQVVDDYKASIRSSSGASFMAVMRGKVSEGIDFADKDARVVIITGIPFPNVKDSRIELKRKYLDLRRGLDPTNLTGNDWYNLEAYRAINQAIGRVIRHKNDFGAILFLDRRFSGSNVKSQLSDWIQPGFAISDKFNTLLNEMKEFF
ncbi:LOW QUALITY PROTEIN: regulator of telomere elongation helicase 1 homolog [Lepeophtheirus salmonis]|uniref:LOW QUALITY PROTEIN: regulator of telomere elongation helicase 1 homolog n=1 Tax=Lepeophtheirus salmonis TaxID=72036 RepID=UPI001AE280EE|nr:LOW QUALITY PROTEIN: regulator of telomere elongation helicase 1 homolog [Lepeophtheirus salmonis]